MPWQWLTLFRRNSNEAHEDLFEFRQGVIGEKRFAEYLKDLAEVGEENLETLARIAEVSKKFQGGEMHVAAAAQAYDEAFSALVATPSHLFPTDSEDRREAMRIPSNGSTAFASRPMPANGLPGESSQPVALPNPSKTTRPDQPAPEAMQGLGPELPRRKRGRPPGSKSKPKPPLPTPGSENGRQA